MHIWQEHDEAARLFHEVNSIELMILQQFFVSIEPKYFRELETPGTNKLNHAIPDIFDNLFDTNGDMSLPANCESSHQECKA